MKEFQQHRMPLPLPWGPRQRQNVNASQTWFPQLIPSSVDFRVTK